MAQHLNKRFIVITSFQLFAVQEKQILPVLAFSIAERKREKTFLISIVVTHHAHTGYGSVDTDKDVDVTYDTPLMVKVVSMPAWMWSVT